MEKEELRPLTIAPLGSKDGGDIARWPGQNINAGYTQVHAGLGKDGASWAVR
jgi:hypothetical protein